MMYLSVAAGLQFLQLIRADIDRIERSAMPASKWHQAGPSCGRQERS
jgi:hypothetical protein